MYIKKLEMIMPMCGSQMEQRKDCRMKSNMI